VLEHERLDLESSLGRKILDDHRAAGQQCVAGHRSGVRRQRRPAHDPVPPADPGDDAQVRAVRRQLEHVDEVDVQDSAHQFADLVEQCLERLVRKRALAYLGDGRLLLDHPREGALALAGSRVAAGQLSQFRKPISPFKTRRSIQG
jgi:hypothetical protein